MCRCSPVQQLCRRGHKPYILGGAARNCKVCRKNNLQGNFCQFKRDGVVCPDKLQARTAAVLHNTGVCTGLYVLVESEGAYLLHPGLQL